MGGLRRSLTNNWSSKWSTSLNNKKQYKFLLDQDLLIKKFVKSFCKTHDINLVLFIGINLNSDKTELSKELFTKKLNHYLTQFTENKVHLFISSINNPLYNAELLSNEIAESLTNRRNYSVIFQNILRNITVNKGSQKLQKSIKGIKIH